jgi:hypothetical protein
MDQNLTTDAFAAAIRNLSTAELVRTAGELNQQSLMLITHLMLIADEIARREARPEGSLSDC